MTDLDGLRQFYAEELRAVANLYRSSERVARTKRLLCVYSTGR